LGGPSGLLISAGKKKNNLEEGGPSLSSKLCEANLIERERKGRSGENDQGKGKKEQTLERKTVSQGCGKRVQLPL